jgi:hypothetical protein
MLGPEAPESLQNVPTFDDAIAMTEKLLPVYDELEKVLALSDNEFDAKYPEFQKKAEAANALAGVLLPALDKVRAKERRNRARLAMLLAAIAVVEGGPEKLKSIRDPFGDGPFEYRKLEQGFELTSKLRFEGEPVKLVVGQRKP